MSFSELNFNPSPFQGIQTRLCCNWFCPRKDYAVGGSGYSPHFTAKFSLFFRLLWTVSLDNSFWSPMQQHLLPPQSLGIDRMYCRKPFAQSLNPCELLGYLLFLFLFLFWVRRERAGLWRLEKGGLDNLYGNQKCLKLSIGLYFRFSKILVKYA